MKTILLTGGSGAIGQAIAELFTENDYQVFSPSRQEMDMKSPESIHQYLAELNRDFDVFVHCAGINVPKPIDKIEREDVFNTMQINALSFYDIVSHLIQYQQIKKNGHIVGVSSIYGFLSRKGRFSYVSSKHCLNGMIKSLAIELGEFNIKVNTVSPGFIDTKMTRTNNLPEVIDGFIRKIPLNKLGQPKDIAELIYFLCSDKNQFIHGQDIVIDGGYSIGGFES